MVLDTGKWSTVKVYTHWINGLVKKMLSLYPEKRVCETVFSRTTALEMPIMM